MHALFALRSTFLTQIIAVKHMEATEGWTRHQFLKSGALSLLYRVPPLKSQQCTDTFCILNRSGTAKVPKKDQAAVTFKCACCRDRGLALTVI